MGVSAAAVLSTFRQQCNEAGSADAHVLTLTGAGTNQEVTGIGSNYNDNFCRLCPLADWIAENFST